MAASVTLFLRTTIEVLCSSLSIPDWILEEPPHISFHFSQLQKQLREAFYKGVDKNLAKLTGKLLCHSLFCNKAYACNFIKSIDSGTVAFLWTPLIFNCQIKCRLMQIENCKLLMQIWKSLYMFGSV